MKNKPLIIFVICFLLFSSFNYSIWKVNDKKALKTEIAEFASKLAEFNKYINKFKDHLYNIRTKIARYTVVLNRGFHRDKIDAIFDSFNITDIDELYNSVFLYDKSNSTIWNDITKTDIIGEKYPSLSEENIDHYKDNTFVNNNEKYKFFINNNKKKYKEFLTNLKNNITEINAIKKLTLARKNRFKQFNRKLRVYSEASYTVDGWWNTPMNLAKVVYLRTEIKYEKLLIIEQIRKLIKIKFENALKSDVFAIDYMQRYKELNSNTSENIKKYLEK